MYVMFLQTNTSISKAVQVKAYFIMLLLLFLLLPIVMLTGIHVLHLEDLFLVIMLYLVLLLFLGSARNNIQCLGLMLSLSTGP